MNKIGAVHYHLYLRDIPIFIWILAVAIACIIMSKLIPALESLAYIGIILLIILFVKFIEEFYH